MLAFGATRFGGARTFLGAAWIAAAAILVPRAAKADFSLDVPMNRVFLAADGTPEKLGACGDEPPQMPTDVVTSYMTNPDGTTTLNIQLHEALFHPGHYRVAIAADESSLPPDPEVTASTQDECAMAAIQAKPPVLADNLLVHTTAFDGPQAITVTVPAGVTCSPKCTLQVIEFMSSHPQPCFYHHCADISISPGAHDAGTSGAVADAEAPDVVVEAGALEAGRLSEEPMAGSGCSVSHARTAVDSQGAAVLFAATVGIGASQRRKMRHTRSQA